MAIAVTDKAVAEIKKAAGARAATPERAARRASAAAAARAFPTCSSGPIRSRAPEDKVLSFEDGDVRVFVDPKSYLYLDGSTLEYQTTMMGRGFKFTNPNVKGTCGCGESVQF